MSISSQVRVAVVQSTVAPGAYEQNRARVEQLLEKLKPSRPQIVVLPELFLHGHGYRADRNSAKEAVFGPTLSWLQAMSNRLGAILVGGINEEIPGDTRCFSTLLCVDGDKLLGTYRKRHPASAESLFLKNGVEDGILETRFGRIGLLICFDMSFPDAVLGPAAARVDLMLVSNAWVVIEKMPFLLGETFEHHRVLPRALAMQLRAPVAVANLVGPTAGLLPGIASFGGGVYPFETEFTGGSLICDHMGVVLAERTRDEGEGHASAQLDLDLARGVREVAVDHGGLDELEEYIFGAKRKPTPPSERQRAS